MTLSCQRINGHITGKPWLIFLHGLLGRGDDWQPLMPWLSNWPCLLIDLPGHGASADITAAGFADVSQQLSSTLQQQSIHDHWLIGYSLGGRISLYHASHGDTHGLCGVIVEGAHPGLKSLRDRQQRHHHDQLWATRFRFQPMAEVLQRWYRQPVFSDLSDEQRQQLVALRINNNPSTLAAMFTATSLAVQPCLRERLSRLALPVVWLCGSHDSKFITLAQQANFPLRLIANAGHNAHRANPADFARQALALISSPVLKEIEHDLS
ncbi:2-succinyl-6-hydroxy-2, 4-cyclohexadiene-1-carboxylate synthase [Enterobacterales bacterium]|nr:2-succinyl-6-hydroxy-2, 4-cyclohexadiene-1-carboxylate synthase [Enterobacterales bacterium]